jgi:hypothetical protein
LSEVAPCADDAAREENNEHHDCEARQQLGETAGAEFVLSEGENRSPEQRTGRRRRPAYERGDQGVGAETQAQALRRYEAGVEHVQKPAGAGDKVGEHESG